MKRSIIAFVTVIIFLILVGVLAQHSDLNALHALVHGK